MPRNWSHAALHIRAALTALLLLLAAPAVAAAALPGDCDGDGAVSIGEVQRAINMFLGIQAPACGADANGDGSVSIGEVQKVINAFLGLTGEVAVSVTPVSVIVLPGGTQQFVAAVTGTANTAVTWSVQEGLGGGSVSVSGLYTAPATAGTYHVVATSHADPAKSAMATVTVEAGSCTVACSAQAGPTSGQAPLTVNFTAAATATDCSAGVTYAWEFGDGATSPLRNPTHTFTQPGTYAWRMTASSDSATCTRTGSVTVEPGPTCTVACEASASPTSGPAPLEVNFTSAVTPTNCSGAPTYLWTLGDGTTSAAKNPYKVYGVPGTYSWTLTVTVDGQTCFREGTLTVTQGSPDTPLTSGVPLQDTITGTSLYGTWNYYYLDLPAGSTGLTVDVTGLSGDVDLFVRGGQKPDAGHYDCKSENFDTDPEHCAVPLSGPQRAWVAVTNYSVNRAIQYTVTAAVGGGGTCLLSCTATAVPTGGTAAQFTGAASAPGCPQPPVFLWDFGDGNSAMEQSPSHTYAAPGTYSWALLVVTGSESCEKSGNVTVGSE